MQKNNRTIHIVIAALFAALTAVMTAFVKFNITNGYVHFGDSIIYLTACLLPGPYAIAAAAIGGSMADLLAGAAIWSVPTAIIKAVNTLPFIFVCYKGLAKKNRILSLATCIAAALSGVVTVVGYMIAEAILFSFEAALLSVPFGIIQAVGSMILFILLGTALDNAGLKSRLF